MQRAVFIVILFFSLAAVTLQPAFAERTDLKPMTVGTYRVMQQVAHNRGWASTAYRNYLVGLFEGLLSSEGSTVDDRHGKVFCLPTGKGRSIATAFEWMETELNNVVAKEKSNALVARVFVAHLTHKYPCRE
jgi:hypothetical protein